MKKILLHLTASLVCFAQAGTLIPTGPASYSGTAPISATLSLSGAGTATALEFTLTASLGWSITGVSVANSTITASKQLQCSGVFPQITTTCLLWGLNATTVPAGALVIMAGSPTGTGQIGLNVSTVLASDQNGLPIPMTGGALAIPFSNKCDLTLDGVVDGKDVTLIGQRIIAHPPTVPCDFDGSGQCDLFDLMVILKSALGGACSIP